MCDRGNRSVVVNIKNSNKIPISRKGEVIIDLSVLLSDEYPGTLTARRADISFSFIPLITILLFPHSFKVQQGIRT